MASAGEAAAAEIASGGAADAPAGSIGEAIERMMREREAEEAIAEWARGER